MKIASHLPYRTRVTRNGHILLVYDGGRKRRFQPRTAAEREWDNRVTRALCRRAQMHLVRS